jgi:hypothetical protein
MTGVTVLGLPARIKDPLPDRRSTLVGWLPRCAACVNGRLLALGAAVVPRAALLAYAVRRALSLLHGRLLNESMRLAVQVSRLEHQGRGHGPKQRRSCDELLTRAWWHVWVDNVEVSVDALAVLLSQLAHAFAARRGFSGD